jgi:hypothetical protein
VKPDAEPVTKEAIEKYERWTRICANDAENLPYGLLAGVFSGIVCTFSPGTHRRAQCYCTEHCAQVCSCRHGSCRWRRLRSTASFASCTRTCTPAASSRRARSSTCWLSSGCGSCWHWHCSLCSRSISTAFSSRLVSVSRLSRMSCEIAHVH